MSSYRMTFSEGLLNHFVGLLITGLEEVEKLWFDLHEGSFHLNIHGTRYVKYALRTEFEVADVDYSCSDQTIVFRQRRATDVRGRFYLGEYLSYFTDEPFKNYLQGLEFVDVSGTEYTFTLRRSQAMRSFFDTTLTGRPLTELFPFNDLKIKPHEIIFVG